MCCMCLLVGSPRISVQMIDVSEWLHLKSCCVHTQLTMNCSVVVWLLGSKREFTIATH